MNDVAREVLETGDHDAYLRKMAEVMRESPKEFLGIAWQRKLKAMENMSSWLAVIPNEGKPFMFEVAKVCFAVAQEAHRRRGKKYAEYFERSGAVFMYDLEIADRVTRDPAARIPKPDMPNVVEVIDSSTSCRATNVASLIWWPCLN